MCAFVYTMFSPLVDMAIVCVSSPVPHFMFFHFMLSNHSSPGISQPCLYSWVVFRYIGRGWFILPLKCFQCSGTIWHRCKFIYTIRGWRLWFWGLCWHLGSAWRANGGGTERLKGGRAFALWGTLSSVTVWVGALKLLLRVVPPIVTDF